jgi:hypothetical protein
MRKPDFKGENSRKYFRIVYPINDRPVISVGEEEFVVVDLSEKGVKFFRNGNGPTGDEKVFEKGLSVRATLTLNNGEPVEVEGSIIRVTGEEVVLNLKKGVSFSRIIREQWYLIGKYKHLFG